MERTCDNCGNYKSARCEFCFTELDENNYSSSVPSEWVADKKHRPEHVKNLKKVKELVRYILSKYKDARNSDMILYLRVCEYRNERALTMPFYEVLQNLDELCLPPFESVRRARQKIQEENAVFDADEVIQKYRAENEAEYRAFARG